MNQLNIIGNLTRDPETRDTGTGKTVCTFTVAVNGRNNRSDYFRVSAWGATGENCQKYLAKGKKVAVSGPVSVSTYKQKNGEPGASLEVMANDVEFLSPKGEPKEQKPEPKQDEYTPVEDEDLPF